MSDQPETTQVEQTKTQVVEERSQDTQPTLSQEDLQRELREVRKEAAKYRTKLREKEEAETTAAEERRQAEMTAEQRAKDAAKKADEKAQAAIRTANQRLVAAEAKSLALELQARPERVNGILKLADLSEIEVSDDGTVDVKQVREVLEAVLTDYPEWKVDARPTTPISGGNSAGRQGNDKPSGMFAALMADKVNQRR